VGRFALPDGTSLRPVDCLQKEITMAREQLNVGFTADIDPETGVVEKAKSTAAKVKDEAGMVAAHAIDHPTATVSVAASIGVAAFLLGYLWGVSSSPHGGRRWL
jgi:Ethanolamine utilization protein EutJ (predicted chaperonin)